MNNYLNDGKTFCEKNNISNSESVAYFKVILKELIESINIVLLEDKGITTENEVKSLIIETNTIDFTENDKMFILIGKCIELYNRIKKEGKLNFNRPTIFKISDGLKQYEMDDKKLIEIGKQYYNQSINIKNKLENIMSQEEVFVRMLQDKFDEIENLHTDNVIDFYIEYSSIKENIVITLNKQINNFDDNFFKLIGVLLFIEMFCEKVFKQI